MASRSSGTRRVTRIVLAVLGALLVLVLLLAALAAWLIGTESGARALVPRLLERTGGVVAVEGLEGRLIGPLRAERIVIEQPEQRIVLTDVRLDWRARALLRERLLHIETLHAQDMTIVSRVDQPPEDETKGLPDDLSLPLNVRVDALRLDGGSLRRGPATLATLGPLALGLAYQDGKYTLDLRRFGAQPQFDAGSAQAGLQGQLELSARKPYPLDGRFSVNSKARIDERTFGADGSFTFGGNLADLRTQLDLRINDAPVTGDFLLHPFAEQVLGRAELRARAVDLAALDASLPKTKLDIDLDAGQDGAGTLRVRNRAPGTIEEQGVPLQTLELAFRERADAIEFERIHARLGSATQPERGAGELRGSGRYADGALTLKLTTEDLNLRRIDPRLRATQLAGTIEARHAEGRQEFELDLTEPLGKRQLALKAHGVLADAALEIRNAELQAGNGRLRASGEINLEGTRAFQAEGEVVRFRLRDFGRFEQVPDMNLNGGFALSGALEPQLRADLRFSITDSQLAGQPLAGEGEAQVRGERLEVPRLALRSGANALEAQGRLAADGDGELKFSLKAPQLGQLGPAFGGAIFAEGVARGTLDEPRIEASWRAEDARLPGEIRIGAMQGQADVQLDREAPFMLRDAQAGIEARGLQRADQQVERLDARLRFAPQPRSPLALNVDASGARIGETVLDRIVVDVDGTNARHTIEANVQEPDQKWIARATGGLDDLSAAARWEGELESFIAAGRIEARTSAPAPLLLSADQQRVEDLQLDIEGGQVVLERFARDQDGIETRGRIAQLRLGQFLQGTELGNRLKTDLQLSANWDLRYGESLDGTLFVQRDSGDLNVLGAAPVTLGLSELRAEMKADKGRLALDLRAAGERLGRITLDATTRLGDADNPLALPPDAPLAGSARVDMPSLGWIGPLVDPVLVTDGRLQGQVALGGTLGDPAVSGNIQGEALRVAHAEYGLNLRQGTLRSEFKGDRLLVQSLNFEGEQGSVQLSGPIDFGSETTAELLLRADRFAVLNRPDRRLVLSGQSKLDWRDGRARIVGDLTVNSGFFDIGTADRPTLGSDVVIVGREEQQTGGVAAAVDVTVRLDGGVVLRGRGLDATLGGQVRLLSEVGEPLQAYGTLRVLKGTYSAYGRELAVEEGGLRFTGPINNPALDILAMRRGQEVEAGVSVQGTVLAPRVALVSEPSVPDAEKLAWLVLGRSLANAEAGDIGSLQDAAASLLARGAAAGVQSRIASAFGLDTFSVGTTDDSLQERIVTLGKQLSSRLYLGYQHGLESAAGVVQLRYMLTPSLSLEAEAGARSALSLFYNITFD